MAGCRVLRGYAEAVCGSRWQCGGTMGRQLQPLHQNPAPPERRASDPFGVYAQEGGTPGGCSADRESPELVQARLVVYDLDLFERHVEESGRAGAITCC